MTQRVDSDKIEAIVGISRHPARHYARAVSAEQRVYILHSQECLDSGIDLRDCDYSRALDYYGIDPGCWVEDQPVHVAISAEGELLPDGAQ
jgi:hypothetical protein